MNIEIDDQWAVVEAQINAVRAEAHKELTQTCRAHKQDLLALNITIHGLEHERDVCRNALILALNGDNEAVRDAYCDALASLKKNKGWLY